MPVKFDFAGHHVLITGGTNGIGFAIAQAFAKTGAFVSITGTRPSSNDYQEDLRQLKYYEFHLEDKTSIDNLITQVKQVDVLINNAGIVVRGDEAFTPEGFEKNVAANLNAAYHLCQGLHSALKSRPGNIINVASMYSYFACASAPGYGASKAGIVQLTKTLSSLYAADRIRVNAIAPGWIETNLTAETRRTPELNRRIIERTPLRRWGKPHEVSGAALFLASNEFAAYVTGTTISVDGGYSAC